MMGAFRRKADGTARAKCVGVPSTGSGQALRQAQDKLRSLPALIKAIFRNECGLFLLRSFFAFAMNESPKPVSASIRIVLVFRLLFV